MKRYLNWVLGAFAAVTAIAALRPRRQPAPVETAPAPVAGGREDWKHRALAVARGVVQRTREHNIPIIAGSLSYYAFLAIFPAAIAAISIYGLVLDPTELTAQINDLTRALPTDTASFVSRELTDIVASSRSGLGFTAVASIVGALWSASAGTKALIVGIDIAYDTPENRPFIVQRAMALGITMGLIVFVAAAASAATFLPHLLDAIGAERLTPLVEYGRWPLIFISVIVGLGILFKIAPNRPASKSPWISVGAVVVAVVWLLATVALSVYTSNVDSLGATYGALSGVIVLMLWFFASGLIVLVGAELNAELEAQNLARLNRGNGRR